eukprot:TRINITY_DN2900_c0_g1_i2.p1 TRINITY_DN2900_c0_g1~~TRINITY_DN2900_c0_g1_i2.p1  ORF type:complete len:653 (-),score=99.91 TRINITY_DN2900_c0_g1_i2:86-2044(-)
MAHIERASLLRSNPTYDDDVESASGLGCSLAQASPELGFNPVLSDPLNTVCYTKRSSSLSLLYRWFYLPYTNQRDKLIRTISIPHMTHSLLPMCICNINLFELVILALFCCLVALFGNSNTFGNTLAIMTMVQLFPVARKGLLHVILGISFERGIKYHRWTGTIILVFMFLHSAEHLHIYSGKFEAFKDSRNIFGTVAVGCYVIIFLTSLPFVRRRFYELFHYTHFLFIPYLICAALHESIVWQLFLFPLGLYLIDWLFRIICVSRVRASSSTATITRCAFSPSSTDPRSPEAPKATDTTTKSRDVSFLHLNKPFDYEAGQYCLVCLPAISLVQWHPLSIVSSPLQPNITFMCKDTGSGGWTSALANLPEGDTPIMLEGPYGRPSIRPHAYASLVLFAGGHGVTPVMSVLRDVYLRCRMRPENVIGGDERRRRFLDSRSNSLNHSGSSLGADDFAGFSQAMLYADIDDGQDDAGEESYDEPLPKRLRSAVTHVHLVWSVRSKENVAWFHDSLRDMLENPAPNLEIEVSIHATGSGDFSKNKFGDDSDSISMVDLYSSKTHFSTGVAMQLAPVGGRPAVYSILETALLQPSFVPRPYSDQSKHQVRSHTLYDDVGVYVCGPKGMSDSAKLASRIGASGVCCRKLDVRCEQFEW